MEAEKYDVGTIIVDVSEMGIAGRPGNGSVMGISGVEVIVSVSLVILVMVMCVQIAWPQD